MLITRRSLLKHFPVLAGSLTGIATACSPQTSPSPSSLPIKVGIISPLTGSWAVWAKAHLAGALLAIDEINRAGGVLGRRLEPVVVDSKTQPKTVVEVINRLINQDQVAFIAGTFSSAERNAAGPVVRRKDKVLLYPTWYEGQHLKYFPGVCNSNIFMFGPEPSQQSLPHVNYMVKTFGSRFFLIGSKYAWGYIATQAVNDYLQNMGIQVVGHVTVPLGTKDFAALLEQIKALKTNVIFSALAGDTFAFRRQLYQSGLKQDLVFWSVDDEELATMSLGSTITANDYASFDYFMSIETPNNHAFLQRFQAKFGQQSLINTVGVAMYNAIHMTAIAIQKSGDISSSAIRQGLKGMAFKQAPQGTVQMRLQDNQIVVPSYLMRVKESWTSANNMFQQVQSFPSVDPQLAKCKFPLA